MLIRIVAGIGRVSLGLLMVWLCKRFIDARGTDPEIFKREAEKRNWSVWNADPMANEYNQNTAPVREQSDAIGHAVRAVYLYTGMADLASETDDCLPPSLGQHSPQADVHNRRHRLDGYRRSIHG